MCESASGCTAMEKDKGYDVCVRVGVCVCVCACVRVCVRVMG